MRTYEPDGAVLSAFLQDRSRVAVIQGPIGSGTSSGSMMRLFMHLCEQKPGVHDGVRRSRWAVVRNCYDDETEVLSESGWKLFRDLAEGEKVAQLRDGVMEFVAPTYYYAAPYDGDLVGFEGEGVDFRVTPDHRMWVSQVHGRGREWADYGFRLASEIEGSEAYRVRRDAGWVGVDPGRTPEFFEWLGYWYAEGCSGVYEGRHQCVVTSVNDVEYARGAFVAAGLPFTEHVRKDGGVNFRLSVTPETKPLIAELAMGGSRQKFILEWAKNAPPEHLRRFIKGYIAGDGHHGTCKIASTASKALADDLQEVALRAGYVANIGVREVKHYEGSFKATGPEWVVTFVTERKYRPRLQNRSRANRYRGWYREQYRGTVYCIEVPTHVIYVRRKGRAFWCSQTYPELEETTIKTWLDWFPEELFGVMKVTRPPTHHVSFSDVEAEIVFLALDSPDDIRKLRSSEWTGFLFNELQYIPKEIFDEADSRVGRFPSMKDGGSEWVGILADMNAPEPGHFVLYMRGDEPFPEWMTPEERLEFDVPESWRFFVQPPAVLEKKSGGQVVGYEVNRGQGDFAPAENMKWLDPKYYENMLVGKSRAFIRTRMMNVTDFFVDGQPVWKDFREELHVSREPLEPFPGVPILVGLDFGRQPAFVAGQVVRDRVRILAEGQATDSSSVKFAPVVKAELAKRFPGREDFEFWGDPSADRLHEVNEHSAFQIFQAHGMKVHPAPGNNAFRPRVEAVEQQLTRIVDGQPCWLVDPRCRALIGAMRGGYYYPRIKGTTRVHHDPAKTPPSHVAEASQYLALGAGLGRTLIGRDKGGKKVNTKARRQSLFRRRVA